MFGEGWKGIRLSEVSGVEKVTPERASRDEGGEVWGGAQRRGIRGGKWVRRAPGLEVW